jgi:hypothetical protein
MRQWEHDYLEWVHQLHLDGVEVPVEIIAELHHHGIMQATDYVQIRKQTWIPTVRPIEQKHQHEIEADKLIDIVYEDETEDGVVETLKYSGGKKITKADWLPHKGNVLNPERAFVEWIDSGLNGFSHIKHYEKFELYIQQSNDWLAEATSVADCDTYDEVVDFVMEERERWKDNSLYFADKYLNLKQGAEDGGGTIDFKAWRCQAFIAYLIDCGFSAGIGKLRQVGFSSLIGGIAIKKMLCHPNMFIKFIAENLKKTEEIFNDKIKFAFYELPSVFRPTVKNDTGHSLVFAPKSKKGHGKRRDAKLLVEAPYETAINGGTPDLILVDEIGQIPILGAMTEEGRPTMFKVVDGEMVMTRQLIAWGTGGEMSRGGAAFETEFRSWVKAWKQRDLRNGIIPVFIDCFSKPGVTREFYEDEKRRVYLKEGVDAESLRVKFHQHYPVTIDDMFLRSSKTIVPLDLIIKYEDMTLNTPRMERGGYGFFEPIYDYSVVMPEFSDTPYKVVGAKWVPTDDSDERGVIYIHRHPEHNWSDRYFQGTDPINSESGNSLMASSIWDEHTREMAAIMNFRVTQYKFCYLQCALLAFYYGQPPHLIESNIGRNLVDYLDRMGLYKTLVSNAMLPDYLQVASTDIGMRLVPTVKPRFIHVVITLIEAYGSGLKFLTFWSQLKTYVEKTTPSGNTKWGPENLKLYNDDVIDSFGYAYVCRMCYERRFPVNRNEVIEARSAGRKMIYDPFLGRNIYKKVMVAK